MLLSTSGHLLGRGDCGFKSLQADESPACLLSLLTHVLVLLGCWVNASLCLSYSGSTQICPYRFASFQQLFRDMQLKCSDLVRQDQVPSEILQMDACRCPESGPFSAWKGPYTNILLSQLAVFSYHNLIYFLQTNLLWVKGMKTHPISRLTKTHYK